MEALNTTNCFAWLEDMSYGNETTLQDINDLFTQRNIGAIVYTVLQMLVGFVGNSLVLWIFSRKFRRTNYRTYTLWLASMDITNCCVGMPFLLLYFTHYVTFPYVIVCKLGRFTMNFTANATAFILVVIAIDRYIHICKPFKFKISKIQRRMLSVSAIVLALGITWPALVLYGNHTVKTLPYNITGIRCWEDDLYVEYNYISEYYVVQAAISFIVTVVLFLVYSLIVRYIYKNKVVDKVNYTRKTTLILLAVTTAYVLSALPHNILLFILFKKPGFQCKMSFAESFVLYIFLGSILFNNSLNPIIYGFSDKEFRTELKKMLKCCFPNVKKQQKESISNSSSNWT